MSTTPTPAAQPDQATDTEKRCRCCGSTYSWSGWLSLPRLGLQVLPPCPGDGAMVHELRACSSPGCRNTLSIDLLRVASRKRRRLPIGWRRVAGFGGEV